MMVEDNCGVSLKLVVWIVMIINNILENIYKEKWQHHKWKHICIISSMLMGYKVRKNHRMHGNVEI